MAHVEECVFPLDEDLLVPLEVERLPELVVRVVPRAVPRVVPRAVPRVVPLLVVLSLVSTAGLCGRHSLTVAGAAHLLPLLRRVDLLLERCVE